MSENLVVITGGPGSGKTTLIERLRSAGYPVVAEAARAIIRDQVTIGGPAHHAADWALGAEVALAWEIRSYREAFTGRSGPVFFDRGIPDLIGYHPMMGRPTPPHFVAAAERFRYRRRAFVAPPWREIYVNDEERTQDFAHAVRSFDAVLDAYQRCGYELVTLPKSTVAERLAFVLAEIRSPCGPRP
jgi:predicted ATPase